MQPSSHPNISQRLNLFMAHIPVYSFDGAVKLARDAGVSSSAIYHILHGRCEPKYRMALAITQALGRRLGKPDLSPEEIFAFAGRFPTPSVCTICGCGGSGCAYRNATGGEWHVSEPTDTIYTEQGGSHA